jgi:hypothetical protein
MPRTVCGMHARVCLRVLVHAIPCDEANTSVFTEGAPSGIALLAICSETVMSFVCVSGTWSVHHVVFT